MTDVASATAPPRVAWRVGTVVDSVAETPTARRLRVEVPGWPGNDAGSHLDIRLTAPDGYQASRSYSIASSGPGETITLAVDEVPDGEVSPFLVRELRAGDRLEVHGPLGAYFVWRPDAADRRPVQLIAGGSGVVPLVAMAESHARSGDPAPFRLLYSVRTPEDVFFRAELDALTIGDAPALDLRYAYTRRAPDDWATAPGRITRTALEAAVVAATATPRVFVCGPTPFVETVADWLLELGHDPSAVRTERFGGS